MEATREATTPNYASTPAAGGHRTSIPSFHLAGSREGIAQLSVMLARVADAALAARRLTGPLPAGTAGAVITSAAAMLGRPELPETGIGSDAALDRVARVMVAHGLDLAHPLAAAHLQPPPLAVAVVADALASASNASLDTYDSGPSAIAIECWLIGVLTQLAGLGPRSDGVLTPGGSLSNLLGLLLARDAVALQRGVDVRRRGVAALAGPRVLCSEVAHFSVHRACAALGLGESAVCTVPTDHRHRMRPAALARVLDELGPDHTPLAIVATAGTTDFGSVDPIAELAELARARRIWLHVDAAYGFGAMFSDRLRDRLAGLARADSITLDLHKLGWQPAAASALLVADRAAFAALDREVAYLNPEDDTATGLDGLLGRSLQTTRRPDALKIAATLLAYGRRGLGEMVDICHDLARHAEQRIAADPALELVAPAELTTIVFRYRGQRRDVRAAGPLPDRGDGGAARREDELNAALRRRLLETGEALIGRTAVHLTQDGNPGAARSPRVCLKLTLLNPTATAADIDALIDAIVRAGRACEARTNRTGGGA